MAENGGGINSPKEDQVSLGGFKMGRDAKEANHKKYME